MLVVPAMPWRNTKRTKTLQRDHARVMYGVLTHCVRCLSRKGGRPCFLFRKLYLDAVLDLITTVVLTSGGIPRCTRTSVTDRGLESSRAETVTL
jgi:hypothetical protein